MTELLDRGEIASAMRPLLARGQDSWNAYVDSLPEGARPIGGASMHIVRDGDYCAAIRLCLAFVRRNRQPLYILDDNNDLSCHMGPFLWRR